MIGSKTLVLICTQTIEIEEMKEGRKERPDQRARDGSLIVSSKKKKTPRNQPIGEETKTHEMDNAINLESFVRGQGKFKGPNRSTVGAQVVQEGSVGSEVISIKQPQPGYCQLQPIRARGFE